jgi:ABC-type phosphate transport system substrate-binding protein
MRVIARQLTRQLMVGSLLLAHAAWAAQPQIAVITAPNGPQLTLDHNTLRNVYLKKIFVDGTGLRLTPVNLPSGAPLRDAFSGAVLQMDGSQLQAYWDRQYFQGVSPPYVLGSQDAVVRFVASTPGAIGYVAVCHVDASVHIALLITLPPRTPDDLSDCMEHHRP